MCRSKKQLKGAHLLPDFKGEILDKDEPVKAVDGEAVEAVSKEATLTDSKNTEN